MTAASTRPSSPTLSRTSKRVILLLDSTVRPRSSQAPPPSTNHTDGRSSLSKPDPYPPHLMYDKRTRRRCNGKKSGEWKKEREKKNENTPRLTRSRSICNGDTCFKSVDTMMMDWLNGWMAFPFFFLFFVSDTQHGYPVSLAFVKRSRGCTCIAFI